MRNETITQPGAPPLLLTKPRAALLTLLLLAVALALSLSIAVTNGAYFELLNRPLGLERPLARALLFSSYLLLWAAPFVLPRPAAFGLRLGEARRQGRRILTLTVVYILATAAAVTLVGGTPYSRLTLDNVLIETVIVPVSEELLFRGVGLTLLLAALARLHPPGRARWLAVGIGAVAFGAAHLANATVLPLSFVLPQALFAVAVGLGCGALMLRCRSLYPAIWLHAAVNLVVVLL